MTTPATRQSQKNQIRDQPAEHAQNSRYAATPPNDIVGPLRHLFLDLGLRYSCLQTPYPTLTLPYPTLPYPTLPYPALPYPTLPYPTLPYPTLSCPTQPLRGYTTP